MKRLSLIFLAGGFLALAYGLHSYRVEADFESHAVRAMAHIENVKDEAVLGAVEGTLTSPHVTKQHVCRYTIAIEPTNQPRFTTELTTIGRSCLWIGNTVAVTYDSREPHEVRDQTGYDMLPPGAFTSILGIILILASCHDFYRARRGALHT